MVPDLLLDFGRNLTPNHGVLGDETRASLLELGATDHLAIKSDIPSSIPTSSRSRQTSHKNILGAGLTHYQNTHSILLLLP